MDRGEMSFKEQIFFLVLECDCWLPYCVVLSSILQIALSSTHSCKLYYLLFRLLTFELEVIYKMCLR